MSFKTSPKKLRINLLFLILLFITCLDSFSNIAAIQFFLKHIDELLTLLFLIYVCLNYKIALKLNRNICVAWNFILFIGLISNLVYGYQGPMAFLIDAFILCNRFLLGYLAVRIYTNNRCVSLSNSIEKLVKFITIVLFVLAIHDIFLSPFFERSEYRYFMYSIKLMFPHVTYLAFASATLLIFWGYKNGKHSKYPYMLMSSFLCFITLRSKAIGFLLFYWMFYLTLHVFKKKHLIFMFIMGAMSVILVAWDQIQTTFFTVGRFSPRSILLKDSIGLMVKHFPLGTGFGTFGTTMATTYYSPLYSMLGYQGYRGMSMEDPMFLADSFWPAVFAQLGGIGTVFFIYIVIQFLKRAMNIYSINKNAGFSMLMILAYLLITSIAESAFFNPAAFLMFMMFAVFERESKKRK